MVKKIAKFFKRLFNPKADVSVTFTPKATWDDGIKPTGFSFKITKRW